VLEDLLGFVRVIKVVGILLIVIFLKMMCEVGYIRVTSLHLLSKPFMQATTL
jgi:hypothetical protein